jgi:para-aminobenzoate synthetase/4-amino-4-deoxychorismate lyase
LKNDVVLRDAATRQWLCFREPVRVVTAECLDDVLPALREVESLVNTRGLWAAGFISYEAAPAFDSALRVRQMEGFPLLWFGVYDSPSPPAPLPLGEGNWPRNGKGPPPLPSGERAGVRGESMPREWHPSINRECYESALARIKDYIARGHTYQVNYTLRLRAPFTDDAYALFEALVRAQPVEYAAYVDIGPFAVCSVSPELFFRLDGRRITARPMKGTAPRGRFTAEDRAQAERLRHSEKNRAENVMIVDMLRNDLGRIAEIGSVRAPGLFEIERYPTVWQMTSTVAAETEASLAEIMTALFPCASITGAPKARTMQIIAELEAAPRRVYTGCIGFIAPRRQAQFNVAIRTVLVDRSRGEAEYGVGGGIVWDSDADDEYAECQHKARVLTEPRPEFSLLESLRWSPDEGYFLLEHHLRRLCDSADYFDVPVDTACVKAELEQLARSLPPGPHKVRLLVARDGAITVEAAPLTLSPAPVRLALAPTPINSGDKYLFHKTTHRPMYDALLKSHPDADDVILWNERGEVTETCHANIVVQLGGELVTPPVECGLLAGTYRAWLLEQGKIRERAVTLDDLSRAQAVYRVNSVRGWQAAVANGLSVTKERL